MDRFVVVMHSLKLNVGRLVDLTEVFRGLTWSERIHLRDLILK